LEKSRRWLKSMEKKRRGWLIFVEQWGAPTGRRR
jgi:hypothetical protein